MNVPNKVRRALRALAATQHGRSAEAEIRDILEPAVKPAKRIRLGDALAALGRKVGLTDEDVAIIDQTRDKSPAEPTILSERPSLVRRDQNVEPVPLGRPEEIAVAQLMPTHLKGVPDFDAGENRPQTARDAVIEKDPQARCGTLAFLWLS
jgi:plasmid stability protein